MERFILTFLPRLQRLQPIQQTAIVAIHRRPQEQDGHHHVEFPQPGVFVPCYARDFDLGWFLCCFGPLVVLAEGFFVCHGDGR